MTTYRNILVALDVSNEAESILKRAIDVADKYQSNLILTNIVMPIATQTNYDLTPSIDIEIEQTLLKQSDNFLQKLTEQFGLTNAKVITSIGVPKHEIHRLCEEEKIDLVVIGTHGRHGFSVLLGSTANAILHGTKCDVLTVKV